MIAEPSPTASNGRTGDGRFAQGNTAGKGNPFAKRAGELRAALFDAVSDDDLRAVIIKLIELAKGGDTQAARLVLDRVLGAPVAVDLLEKIEALEERFGVA